MKWSFVGCLSLVALFVLPGGTGVVVADSKIKVTTTVSMVTDLVRQVGGDRVQVQGLMGPGVDPHLYKATASDVLKLQQADVIFYSGLLLEGKMQDILAKLARTKKFVYAVTEAIPVERLLEPPEFNGHYDPHVWFEVPLWELCVETVVRGLSERDPAGKAEYTRRGAELRHRMKALHQWAQKKAAELPSEKRVLVTSHDAYNYFGRASVFRSWACRASRPSPKPTWRD
jgi:manganese/zinc/iron transport system substrate-binding protein